jgi:ParB/RepB/Spo0J family partition protein
MHKAPKVILLFLLDTKSNLRIKSLIIFPKGGKGMDPTEKNLVNLKNNDQIVCLPCNKLKDHPLHYNFYAQSHLEELVCSIRETGLLEPILVCPIQGGLYRILCGHYRIRAIRRLRCKDVQCRVILCDEHLSFIIYCTSNILNHIRNAIEEAYMMSKLMSVGGFKASDVAKIWGKSISWVSRRLALLKKLDPEIKNHVEKGYLSPRTAQELTRLPRGKDQHIVLQIIKRDHLSKEATSQLVTWWLANKAHYDISELSKLVEEYSTANRTPISNNQREMAVNELSKCVLILDRLINAVQKENDLVWWPTDEYLSFKEASDHLSMMLDENLIYRGVVDHA